MTQELRRLISVVQREAENDGYKDRPESESTLEAKDMLMDAILELLDRLEKAEKDAARLDWLNLAGNRFSFHLSGTWYSRKDHGSPYRKHGNIRLAIDAAMEASK